MGLKGIGIDRSTHKELGVIEQAVQSERWMSDMHFYKEGTFNHRIMNADKLGRAVTVEVQEHLPRWLRPYIHEL